MRFNATALNGAALDASGFLLVTGSGALTVGDVVSTGSGAFIIPPVGSGAIVVGDVTSTGTGFSGYYGSGAIVVGDVTSRARIGFQWVEVDASIWTERTVSASTWTEAVV
jgi:hypothetical protein